MEEERKEMNGGDCCDICDWLVSEYWSLPVSVTDSSASPDTVVITLSSSHCTYLNTHRRLQCLDTRSPAGGTVLQSCGALWEVELHYKK